MNTSKKRFSRLFLFLLSLLVWLPLLFISGNSFFGKTELIRNFQGLSPQSSEYVIAKIFPQYPTIRSYLQVLMDRPEFFVYFKNSIIITVSSVIGQFLVAIPASWWFAKLGKKSGQKLLFLYTILMIMPFQVTMLSTYLVLQKLNLLDTYWSIILPMIFSSFPIVLMTESFAAVPDNIIEAAQIDGASSFKIFWKIGIPEAKSGIFAALTLTFLECWNLVEQPLIFLKDPTRWPLSLFTPALTPEMIGVYFAIAILTLIVPVLVFLMGQSSLESGVLLLEKE